MLQDSIPHSRSDVLEGGDSGSATLLIHGRRMDSSRGRESGESDGGDEHWVLAWLVAEDELPMIVSDRPDRQTEAAGTGRTREG